MKRLVYVAVITIVAGCQSQGTVPKITRFIQTPPGGGTTASMKHLGGTTYRMDVADRSTEGPRFDDIELKIDVGNLEKRLPAVIFVGRGVKSVEIQKLTKSTYALKIFTMRPIPGIDCLAFEFDTAYSWPPEIQRSKTQK